MANPNPYYNDPFIAQIASNLTNAFIDKNPGQTMVAREHANVYRLQGGKLQREMDKRSAIASTFRNLKGRAPTPEEVSGLTGDAIEGDMKPGDLGGMTLFHASNSGQDDSSVARAFVGSGKGLSKGEAVSLGDRENIRTKDAANDKARSDSSAGISAGATITAAKIAEGGRMARRYDSPVDYAPGHGKSFSPGDTRAPKDYQPGDVPVPVPAKPGADKYVQSEDPANPGKNVWTQVRDGAPGPARPAAEKYVPSTGADGVTTYQPVAPGLPVAAPKPATTPDIRPNEIADVEFQVLSAMGAVSPDGKSVVPEFKKLHGRKMEGAKIAAAKRYQETRSAAEAERAYREYLGIEPGSTLEQPGPVSRLFGASPRIVGPDGDPAPAGSNPAAAAAPSANLPPAVAAGLREGVQTTFGNGQVWTKQNGAPVRVK